MKNLLIIILILSTAFIALFAKGVEAGTIIKNRATLDFIIEDDSFSIKSNIDKSFVDQVIDVKVSWIDTGEVSVNQGEKERVLTFKILNSGNGNDEFNLILDELKNKSEFLLKNKKLYIDSNKNHIYDLDDKIITSIKLNNDQSQLLFVVSDIPNDIKMSMQSKNYINLIAKSKKGGSGKIGVIYNGVGVGGTDAIDGLSGGISEAEGIYKLLSSSVVLVKSVHKDNDKYFTVSIDVSLNGKCGIKKIFIKDDIVSDTEYINNSLSLDGVLMSNYKDSKGCFYEQINKDSEAYIKVYIGDMGILDHHKITYRLRYKIKKENR